MTIKLITAFILSFIIATIVGKYLVPWLVKIKAGQKIREDGPTWHMSKSGTPTMGGIIFIAGVCIVCITVGFSEMLRGEYGHIFVLLFSMIYGAIGFLDDYEKLRKQQNLGLTARKKFLLQLVVALAFLFLLRRFGYLAPTCTSPSGTRHPKRSGLLCLCRFCDCGHCQRGQPYRRSRRLAAGTTLPVCVFFSAVTSSGPGVSIAIRGRACRRPWVS